MEILRSGILEAAETGKIRPEVREALPVSENDSIAAAQVRIWAENRRLKRRSVWNRTLERSHRRSRRCAGRCRRRWKAAG